MFARHGAVVNTLFKGKMLFLKTQYASIAQLDRASVYGTCEQGFDISP